MMICSVLVTHYIYILYYYSAHKRLLMRSVYLVVYGDHGLWRITVQCRIRTGFSWYTFPHATQYVIDIYKQLHHYHLCVDGSL